MYKLLIVEDEKTIAQGIANSITWADWGFEIAGICYNGQEAVEFVERDKPDLVLSDIRMPHMDGIALMQFLNRNYPEIKIIILSGYNDFEYLQMSIRNHVAEYLLKPTDLDEFENLFRRLKTDLDQEGEKRKEQEAIRKERNINGLLKGYGYDEEEVEEEWFADDTERFGVVLYRIENGCQGDKSVLYRQKLLVADTMNLLLGEGKPGRSTILDSVNPGNVRSGRFLCNYEEEIVGLFCVSEELKDQELPDYVKLLADKVQERTGFCLSGGISSFYGDYRMLPQCYEQTKCCISQSMFHRESARIFCFHQLSDTDFDYYKLSFDEERILKCILNQDREGLKQEIQGTFSNLKDQTVKDYDYVNRMSQEILFIISRKMLKYNIRPEQIMNENGYAYGDISSKRTLEAKQDFLTGIFGLFMAECAAEQGKNTKTRELAKVIRDIVDSEYMSNLISLEYVAEKVRKNAAYISKIFKNEFECNFSSYITEKRLEKSRELLENPMVKIYEISQQLGWADVSNYIKVFKRKYGISPDEYRRISVK